MAAQRSCRSRCARPATSSGGLSRPARGRVAGKQESSVAPRKGRDAERMPLPRGAANDAASLEGRAVTGDRGAQEGQKVLGTRGHAWCSRGLWEWALVWRRVCVWSDAAGATG